MKVRIWAFLFLLCVSLGSNAQQNSNPLAGIANYEGSDRMERLIAGARKEGSLTLYTSIAATDVGPMLAEFEKTYGIKVTFWRAANDKVALRVTSEQAAHRNTVDVVQIAGLELEGLARAGVLQEVQSPVHSQLLDGAVPAHRQWAAHYQNVWVQAYNTKLIRRDELPRSYQDLLDPKWKGRLGIEGNNEEWFYSVVAGMGEAAGLKFFRDLIATNGLSVRSGHSLLNNLVVSGEVPLALTVYNYMPEQAKAKGVPIDWFVIEPAIARANGVAIAKTAPHPYAAMLLYEFILSERTQREMSKLGYVPTSRQVTSPLATKSVHLIDSVKVYDLISKWQALFNKVLNGQ